MGEFIMNLIELREINRLIKEKFYIPTYQRGYRWDSKQVTDLLNDVYEFIQNGDTHNGEFYCLQPIVVKKREDGRYDVIDGQQRLTTIMIIQKLLGKITYSIEYASREGSSEFLDNIVSYAQNDDFNTQYRNIDFFFMANAYVTAKSWFETIIEETEEYSLYDDFSVNLLKNCKVIWYEVDDGTNAESIFTRLNIGKIPLTNAELVKALFLKKSNFKEVGDITYLRQLEIASEWDNIENTLQNDNVWYFINPKYDKPLDTRIEYILDVITEKSIYDDTYYTFQEFSKKLDDSDIFALWKQVKFYYQTIMEWYDSQDLYHLIGFITSSSMPITLRDLMNEYFGGNYKKKEFRDYIESLIKNHFKNVQLEELSYETSKDKRVITDILLLFNVITVMNKSSAYSRFPFDAYNKNMWSLEHIHAQNADGIGNSKDRWKEWIQEHLNSFKQFPDDKYHEVVERLESVDVDSIVASDFIELFNEISEMIKDDYCVDIHSIDNLALLERDVNSSISNNFFDVKRNMIIRKDKDGEFIPVCTRNVFLKYYSNDPSHIHYWSEADRTDYLNAIKKVLEPYLG